jgi:biotin/methionine sulfoxide reductase
VTRFVPHSSHWGNFTAAEVDGEVIVVPDRGDPEPSSLLANIPGVADSRVRVRHPYVRRGWLEQGPGPDQRRGSDDYVQVSWDDVVARTADELTRCIDTYGNSAIFGGSYGWASAGRFHHAQSQIHRFLNVNGGYTRSLNSYSLGAAQVLLPHIVGGLEPVFSPTSWPVMVEHTQLFVCFGGMAAKNLQVGVGGVSTHTVTESMRRARAAGAQYIVVSPLRSDLSDELEATWLPVVPGTDSALMLALSWVLVDAGLHDTDFLDRHCEGFDVFADYLLGRNDGVAKDPRWAQELCGIPASRIDALAREMASARTMITLSWSLQRGPRGEQPLWAGVALACILGQIGLPGGGFGHGYGATADAGAIDMGYRMPTLPQGRNAVDDLRPSPHIPVARIADMLLNPGGRYDYDGEQRCYPDTKLVYWAGGNPFHHHQDLARLARAFACPDTVIVHEPFWTATARHADIVLPVTTTLERDDISCGRNDSTMTAMRRVLQPMGESKSDYQIFSLLSEALGSAAAFTEQRDEAAWLRHLYEQWRSEIPESLRPAEDFDQFWAQGRLDLKGGVDRIVLYESFRRDPELHPLSTPSGKFEIYSGTIAGFGYPSCPGHPTWLAPDDHMPGTGDYPLVLIANNPGTRLHSQLDHGRTSADSKIGGREPARIGPAAATRYELSTGDLIRLSSSVGSVLAAVVIDENVGDHVVQLATGAWFDNSGPDVATCIHGNPNAVTHDVGTSDLAQGSTGQLTRVRIEKYTAAAPPLTIHSAPVAGDDPTG